MTKILDGKIVRDAIMQELKEKISTFNSVPHLAIIKIGDNPDSDIYVKNKINFAKKIGAHAYLVDFPVKDISQEILLKEIDKLNNDKNVHGIIVQSPLPPQFNWSEAVERVSPGKDVDGLCSINVNKLLINDRSGIVPATALGILNLLNYYNIPIKNKKIVVMGRSDLVGKPVANLMKNFGAIISVVHSQTVEPEKITREADILIVAIGKPELVGAEYIKEGAVIIDVGITSVNRPKNNNRDLLSSKEDKAKLLNTVVGDVDFESVLPIVSAISPVPGGVGPMTVASLFQNLIQAFEKQNMLY